MFSVFLRKRTVYVVIVLLFVDRMSREVHRKFLREMTMVLLHSVHLLLNKLKMRAYLVKTS